MNLSAQDFNTIVNLNQMTFVHRNPCDQSIEDWEIRDERILAQGGHGITIYRFETQGESHDKQYCLISLMHFDESGKSAYYVPLTDPKVSTVNHPPHYGGADNPFEVIKVIEAWKLDFTLGNAVKYIARHDKKSKEKEIEDLEKAKWYLERKIYEVSARRK